VGRALSGKGTVTYAAKAPGLTFERVDLVRDERYQVCLSSPKPEEVALSVGTDCASQQEAFEFSASLAEQVLDDLAVRLKRSIGRERMTGYCLRKLTVEPGDTAPYVTESSLVVSYAILALPTTMDSLATKFLFDDLLDTDMKRRVWRHLFRDALNIEEPIARFMLLYGILLLVCGDNQKKVDDCIWRLRPSTVPSEDRNRRKKTTYCELRNELGHGRPGWNIERLLQKAETLLPEFTAIVAEAIE